MKKLIISQIAKSIIYIALFTLSLNASAQASIVGPVSTEVEGGIIKFDQAYTIIALNLETKEVLGFENKTLAEVTNALPTGRYELTLITNNRKIIYIYNK